ncbi:hypothetical protein BaRGS_00007021 [Batillaria attramentaria]|uniref:Uncharacterized protein n=1 Tax=Batillaria attramentaria TaxID=370345 RepID=A0ABD0LPW6_9CAEN
MFGSLHGLTLVTVTLVALAPVLLESAALEEEPSHEMNKRQFPCSLTCSPYVSLGAGTCPGMTPVTYVSGFGIASYYSYRWTITPTYGCGSRCTSPR